MPLVSVIVVDYEGTVERGYVRRVMACLEQQSDQDFEILLYHDGPQDTAYRNLLSPAQCDRIARMEVTVKRHNDFGHSLRDRGIREASGEYILHLNADNLLYPHAITEIRKTVNLALPVKNIDGVNRYQADIIIFPILMHGMLYHHHQITRHRTLAGQAGMIMTGIPPRRNNIDCMQFVMRRSLWLEEGGWSNKSAPSDGILYERFARKYGIRTVSTVLGEHW